MSPSKVWPHIATGLVSQSCSRHWRYNVEGHVAPGLATSRLRGNSGCKSRPRSQAASVPVVVLPLPHCVTLGAFLNLSGPVPHL